MKTRLILIILFVAFLLPNLNCLSFTSTAKYMACQDQKCRCSKPSIYGGLRNWNNPDLLYKSSGSHDFGGVIFMFTLWPIIVILDSPFSCALGTAGLPITIPVAIRDEKKCAR